MSRSRSTGERFAVLLRRLSATQPPEPAPAGPVETLVMSFLMWDSTTPRAAAAYKRLQEGIVDFNDLRVSLAQEIVELLGERYPAALDRAQRLRASLRHIYKLAHDITLNHLEGRGKREIRQYLRTLDGIVPYVADRVALLSFQAHCVPADERLRRMLAREGICEESVDISELGVWITRQVRAGEARASHLALQSWIDRAGSRSAPGRGAGSGAGKPSRQDAG